MGHDVRDNPTQAIAVTNWTEDLALDCDAKSLSGVQCPSADVLGTLINELQKTGVLRGTTSA